MDNHPTHTTHTFTIHTQILSLSVQGDPQAAGAVDGSICSLLLWQPPDSGLSPAGAQD